MFSLKSLSENPVVMVTVVLIVVGLFTVYFLKPNFIKEGLADFVASSAETKDQAKEEETTKVNYTEDPVKGSEFVATPGSSDPITPEDLLPKSAEATAFDAANPVVGGSPLDARNFLASGFNVGINTVGNSNRNANLSLRSDPPIPVHPVGIWNNTTILPDLERKGLDIC
jgi:hypothetical protein